MYLYTDICFHNVKSVTASSTFTIGDPLKLTMRGAKGEEGVTITLFLNNNEYLCKLIDAINSCSGCK